MVAAAVVTTCLQRSRDAAAAAATMATTRQARLSTFWRPFAVVAAVRRVVQGVAICFRPSRDVVAVVTGTVMVAVGHEGVSWLRLLRERRSRGE